MNISTDRFFSEEHQQPQNWANLEAYLTALGYRFSADPPPRQFVGGFGNLNFLIELNDERHVLRRPPLGQHHAIYYVAQAGRTAAQRCYACSSHTPKGRKLTNAI